MKMQVCVEEMPQDVKECPFSRWQSFSHSLGNTGIYQCIMGDKEPCSLKNNKCRHLFTPEKEE